MIVIWIESTLDQKYASPPKPNTTTPKLLCGLQVPMRAKWVQVVPVRAKRKQFFL